MKIVRIVINNLYIVINTLSPCVPSLTLLCNFFFYVLGMQKKMKLRLHDAWTCFCLRNKTLLLIFYRYPGNYITYKFNWHLTLTKMVWQRHCWISLYFNQRSSAGLILLWYISFVILRNLSVIHYFHNNNKSYLNKFLSIVEY